MDRCPVCGFELPEGPNRNCYNCLGRENEAKRYGSRRPVSPLKQQEQNWIRVTSGPPDSLQAKLAWVVQDVGDLKLTPAGERTVRLGINHLLEDVYHDKRYLSNVLRDGGASLEEIRRLRACCMEPFLERLIPAWRGLWKKTLGSGASALVCRWYGLDGQQPAGAAAIAKEFGLPEGEARLALERSLQIVRLSSKLRELELATVEAAQVVLASGCDC